MASRRHRPVAAVLLALTVVFGAIGVASAQTWGEFFVHDDDRYWWFRDVDSVIELALPANPAYVIQREMFGENFLELVLPNRQPYMQVALFEGDGDAMEQARRFIVGRWNHTLKDVKVTENRTIRTNMNLDAHFTVVQGTTADGRTGMVRTVLFTAGDRSAYLVWTGLSGEYTGLWQQAWIEAVNSFRWLR